MVVSVRGEVKMSLPKQQITQGQLILGALDHIDGGILQGWAIDRLNPHVPLAMRVTIDGNLIGVVDCNLQRMDLGHLNLPGRAVGFDYRVPVRFRDGVRHILAFWTLAADPIQLPDKDNRVFSEIHFSISCAQAIDGVVDGLVDGMIQGWALRVDDDTGAKTGGVRLLLSVDGEPVAELVADQFRADLAAGAAVGTAVGGVDACCGFAYALPPDLCCGRTVRLEVHAMPGRHRLRNSPMEVFLPSDLERGRISALIARADEMFRFAYDLRRDLRAALPAERYGLPDYLSWARQNLPKIGPRAAVRYGEIKGRPLVSVLCPVFRPDPAAFLAAVDSVRAQTYLNWELILVDDASEDSRLSEIIASLVEDDARIRVMEQAENGGISAATNRALAAARGEVSVFFDHDDTLDTSALEVMLRARSATGARVLYSDEDKISPAGAVCEPNFKPDYNYRLLLEQSYICHLVMVETALARQIGGLDTRFDGAQDHDFMLRLSELLVPEQIHHVAEMLYHWRISDKSTAANGEAKPYAALAGAAAVAAHLRRREITAKVAGRGGLGCYRTDFGAAGDPGISILIPFRNHSALTRRCVEAVRGSIQGLRYEIILLDNWSEGVAAEDFCVEQANLAETKVIRIAEPFNYSRINNMAVDAARYPYLLFLNNDVRVQGDWLRILLGEALADPKVGAVGAKLLYPNGGVQHAGVVLGIGGVADHAFRGLAGDAPGYMARAICAGEVAAVTAACMLVRREAFEAVGGFDAAELKIAFNDIDLCLKLRTAGYRIIFNPDAVVEHHESMSRGDDLDREGRARFIRENAVMSQRWQQLLGRDPFYNRHFSRDGGIYRDLRVLAPEDERPYRGVSAAYPATPGL
jgi:GT2 family glycosyltransferase